jgi:hypothetical protein
MWGKKRLVHIGPVSSSFRLVVPPLQLGAVGPYPVSGAWFPQPFADEGNLVVSNPVFIPKPSTHRMLPGSIVPHIRPKVFTDNQTSRIKYNYYINSVSNDYNDSQWNRIAEDSITPQERQLGQHVV